MGARQPRPVGRAADRRPGRPAGHARPGLLREHAARGARSGADGGPGRGPPGGHLRHPGGLRPRLRGRDHGAPRRGPARRERRQRILPHDARRPAAGDRRPRRRSPGRRAGARLPPVAGRLPAQGAAGPGRRRHLAAPVRGRPLDLDPQAGWPARDGRQRGHVPAARRRLRAAGARGGTARRRRPSRPGGQALRPAGRTGRGHPGPGAPGGRLPGHRHASRAEVRGAGRPGTARLRRASSGTSAIPAT